MMTYQKVFAPQDVMEAAQDYAANQHPKVEKIYVSAIRWTDGEQGFEIKYETRNGLTTYTVMESEVL